MTLYIHRAGLDISYQNKYSFIGIVYRCYIYTALNFREVSIQTAVTPYRTYLKYKFSPSVKSINAILSLSSSSTLIVSLLLFSLFSTTYSATADAIVIQ